jgi:hypothetical protein
MLYLGNRTTEFVPIETVDTLGRVKKTGVKTKRVHWPGGAGGHVKLPPCLTIFAIFGKNT